MSFKSYFISKSPFMQMGDPLKDLMNKLYSKDMSTSNNSEHKGKDLSAKYNPNEKGKSGVEILLDTGRGKKTQEVQKNELL